METANKNASRWRVAAHVGLWQRASGQKVQADLDGFWRIIPGSNWLTKSRVIWVIPIVIGSLTNQLMSILSRSIPPMSLFGTPKMVTSWSIARSTNSRPRPSIWWEGTVSWESIFPIEWGSYRGLSTKKRSSLWASGTPGFGHSHALRIPLS